jgi:hypothetical protein
MFARKVWKRRARQLEQLFIIDALMETGLNSHPRAMIAMQLAMKDHPGMYLETLCRLETIALIVGTRK